MENEGSRGVPYSRLAFGCPVPIHRGQGDLFNMSPWGPARLDQGGYPPESEPGYDPRIGGRWLFWRSA
jgi:hypothetical protein